MPVYALGQTEHETPFSFGASIPPLTFTWSVGSREVLQLESVYQRVSNLLTQSVIENWYYGCFVLVLCFYVLVLLVQVHLCL